MKRIYVIAIDLNYLLQMRHPAEVCQTCGEAYLDAVTTRHLLHIVEEAARVGVQVDVRSYVAA